MTEESPFETTMPLAPAPPTASAPPQSVPVAADEPDAPESPRARRIRLTAKRWADSLIDMSGGNRLVYYRDLKSGTLDLSRARPEAVTALLAGQSKTIGDLFAEAEQRTDAMRRMRTIRSKMRELSEERGLEAGYLAFGLASWSEPDRTPRSPVLLYALKVTPTSATESDFTLKVATEPEVNPVLLFRLAHDFGVQIDADEVLAGTVPPVEVAGEPGAPRPPVTPEQEAELALEALAKLAARVPGFAIAPGKVLGTFVYEKLPMVQDINQSGALLAVSDVVAALAGETAAARELAAGSPVERSAPDTTPLRDEFLVLDADSSQSRAVNAVVAGQHLVVKGPPGTGKSQTIANLIATLAARGQTALFVAEKRAAIDAVLDRLASVGLSDLVQNLHGGLTSRRELAAALHARLLRVADEHQPHLSELGSTLVARREQMVAHEAAMHRAYAPWDVSVFDAQSRLLGLGADAATPTRWYADGLLALGREQAALVRDQLAEAARLGLFDPAARTGAWDAFGSPEPQQARTALHAATELSQRQLPVLRRLAAQVAAECGLRPPSTLDDVAAVVQLAAGAQSVADRLRPEVYLGPVDKWFLATGDRAFRRRRRGESALARGGREAAPAGRANGMGWLARRRARKEAAALWLHGKPGRAELHRALGDVIEVGRRWRESSVDGRPPRGCAATPEAVTALEAAAASLANVPVMRADVPLEQLHWQADALAADSAGLDRAVRRNGLDVALRQWRADRLLDELTARHADADLAGRAFDHAWLTSVLDHIVANDARLRGFDGTVLHAASEQFQTADAEHIRATPARVRRAAAAHLVATLDRYPEEQDLIRREASKKARHLPTRQLFEKAPHALLAIKPCWAMSPLLVSQVLPAQRLFDVVIFDEASQVLPVDGITAIMRGRLLVVAGDEHQLPPTAFFDKVDAEVEPVGPEDEAYTDDVESLLQAFSSVLPLPQVTHLAWHYRSRDERLIAFSNAQIYAPHGNELVTFPGATSAGSLTHVLVRPVPSARTDKDPEESASGEVAKVVELILEHATLRPMESLGVITMGIKHADRIDAALRRALGTRPDLHSFFGERGNEPFFVKNIERVQGDERDAIILSVGYAPAADGRMLYRFGPLNLQGGQRRLNVAITRAKRRMTVVSSFAANDMDPERLRADGARLLRAYLAYAESQTQAQTAVPAVGAGAANEFEADVLARLTEAGIPLVGRYGVGGQRIDFAAVHPEDPALMVLAIEADGATYHSSPTARDRDRLRSDHLERLGWRFHRIWSTDWFHRREAEIERVVAAYKRAVADVDAGRISGVEAIGVTGVLGVPGGIIAETPPVVGRAIVPRSRDGGKPELEPGLGITEYAPADLVALVRWIESDGRLRTEDDVVTEAMTELGFSRRGPRIVEGIRRAIAEARQPADGVAPRGSAEPVGSTGDNGEPPATS
ncbi:AAA domain-containing protein [Hamadaea tsunoensis]|uniref:AAA domain-containing protein n=1 Tax=Hamadaea tsunoensis TaxID=53368 RepID=UPI00040E5BEF|nr:AAA domain-containing protein [Hamadaea tsunoensis]